MLVEGFRKAHDKAESSFGKGKFLGHRLWSEKPLTLLAKNKLLDKKLTDYLRHEHAVPLLFLVEKILFNLKGNVSLDEIFTLIKKFGVVIILRTQDNRLSKLGLKNTMPESWDGVGCFCKI